VKFWIAGLLLVAIAGCASTDRLDPVPSNLTANALPLGLTNARFFPGVQAADIAAEWGKAIQRQRRAKGLSQTANLHEAQFLAISGGGDNGAFGSGLLVGWTEAGNRPEFEVVTGVSTGALIAPFAFLGPKYDRQLRDVYTTVSAKDIYSQRMIVDAIYNDAMADTTPLWRFISKFVDQTMLDRIAEEYQKGRLLFIASTDLDAQRPSIWNVGAIAASKDPRALDLVRKILRASSAVPGFFQPVMIDVELNGRTYQEMHVDGGAIAQMFLYPPSIDLRQIADRVRKAYLIRNARLDPEWASVERRTLPIAGRAISTMIQSSGSNDVLRIYNTTKRDGVDYNLAYIGSDFKAPHKGDFDRAYMNALFDYGYEQAVAGYPWRKVPPILSKIAGVEGQTE
jgi:Patatin-like phospholipase